VNESGEPQESRPLLRIVRGEPDDAELAALTAVVTAAVSAGGQAGVGADADSAPDVDSGSRSGSRSRWADRAALVRRPLPFGPGAWRAAAFPR
jgi:hypothetical protein